jgi:hypothetical protein
MKEWDSVKGRSKEIREETKFMDVIYQVRGGFNEDAGLHMQAGDEDGFSILTQGEDVHIIVQEWINIVYPFLKEANLKEAINLAQDMTNTVINTPLHLRKIWATLRGKVPTG